MEYGGAVQRSIQKIKFGGQWPLAAALAATFRPHPQQHRLMLEWDAVIPVPLHWRRRITRGFNQSTVLARKIAGQLHLPLLTGAVSRIRHTARQARLNAAQRTANLRGAFSVRKGGDVLNKRVLLIDDVVTTGATVKACARSLKKAGAQSICVWSLCRKV